MDRAHLFWELPFVGHVVCATLGVISLSWIKKTIVFPAHAGIGRLFPS
jgi:hypothetical protein